MQPTDSQILAGGKSVTVTDRFGVPRTLFVRQLRRSEVEAYLTAEAIGELEALALVTGVPAPEIDALVPDSVEALVEADRAQNFSFARRVEARRVEKGVRDLEALREQFPEQYEKILGVLERIPGALEKASPSPVSSRVSFAPGPSAGPTPTA